MHTQSPGAAAAHRGPWSPDPASGRRSREQGGWGTEAAGRCLSLVRAAARSPTFPDNLGPGYAGRRVSLRQPQGIRWGGGLVCKSGPTLCDPMNCSPPDSSVHGISQSRILEWVAVSFSRGSS